MEDPNLLYGASIISDVVFRWIHVGSVIVLVGGSVFLRFVLLPSTSGLSDSEHDILRKQVRSRWKRFVHVLIALILISGIYNFVVKAKLMKGVWVWHLLFGMKFLLAMVVFFFAIALVGKSKGTEPLRKNPALWLGLNVLLAALIVMISGVLRFLPPMP